MSAPLDLTAPFNLVTIRVPGTQGPAGPVGPANSLGIGTVTTGAAGSSADATITGTAPSQILNLTIPRGNTGVAGPANVLTIGTVTTSAPGSNATATITGTAPNQTLNLTLPQGAQGPVGAGAPDATSTTKGSIKLAGDMGGTADIPRVTSQADRAYVRSFAATDLVANGTAYLGDNSNFSAFTLDNTDSPVGGGSFDAPTGVGSQYVIDELLPVDLSRRYLLRFQIKQKAAGVTSYMYGFLSAYDIDGLPVTPDTYMFQDNTTTTLATALAPGATTMSLTSTANWNNAAGINNHYRSIIFWNYTDGKGKLWAPETYSRRVKLNCYADGGISGNTITLSSPFDPTQWGYAAGTTIPAGTSVSNGSSGGTYMYGNGMANLIVPSTWTMYESIYSGGTMPKTNGGRAISASANTGFPPGTAFVKVGWLLNSGLNAVGSVAGSKASVASVSLSDATLTDYDVRRATALSTASTIVKRNSAGDAAVNQMDLAATAPVQPYHVTRKDYVDAQIATRAATSHTHTATNISDSTAIGRTVLTAADAPAIRTAIGAGTSNLAIGTTSTTAKAGDYQPTAANISDATTIGRTVLTSVDATAVRTAIGAGTSSLVIGTTSTTAKAGDYQPASANITDSTLVGRSLITAVDAAAARTVIGAGTSNLAIGTTSTTAKAGDYTPPDATTAVKGLVQLANHLGGTATAPTVRSSTSAQTGIVQLATTTEATAAADTTKAVTPAGLADRVLNVSGVSKVQKITQAAYTALGTKDAATLYLIVG